MDTLAEIRSRAIAGAKARIPAPPTKEQHLGLRILPGVRVLDTVSGQEGTVIAGTVTHVIVPAPASKPGPNGPGKA